MAVEQDQNIELRLAKDIARRITKKPKQMSQIIIESTRTFGVDKMRGSAILAKVLNDNINKIKFDENLRISWV